MVYKFAIIEIDSPSIFFTARNKELATTFISRVVFKGIHGNFRRHFPESISHLVVRPSLGVLYKYTTTT